MVQSRASTLVRSLVALARCRRGNVAIIFGLSILPVALMVGAAMDYSRASDARTVYAAAADAAALATVTPTALTFTTAKAQKIAEDVFDTRVGVSDYKSALISRTVSVQDTKGVGRTTTVTFKGATPGSLMKLAGIDLVPVSGDSKSFSAPPVYMDFYMLLDNTPSMGVGATLADITKMEDVTYARDIAAGVKPADAQRCAFACHIASSTNDNYALAKKNNVTMRIDVVRQATQQLMDTAAATATVTSQFRAAVYTFGASCGASSGPQTISTISSNLTAVKTSAALVDLMLTPSQNYYNDQCTDFDGILATMNKTIPSPGDGSSMASPQKVMFFVSDGVADAYYPSTCSKSNNVPGQTGRCQEPITLAGCQALKDRGIKIAVLYTTYLPLPTNSWYNQWISPFATSIGTQMSSCASPGFYFEVSPSGGISDAMNALFQKAVTVARLSQ